MLVPERPRHGDQLVECDEDHDPGNGSEDVAEDRVGEEGEKHERCDPGAEWLGEAGEDRPEKRLLPAPGGGDDRGGDRKPLRDVVDRDGDGDRDPERRILQRADERRHPFREVVDPDAEGDEQTRLEEAGLLSGLPGAMLLGHVVVRDQHVDEEHRDHPGEEGDVRWREPGRLDSRLEELDERDVEHHAAREAERQRHESRPRLLR